MPILRPSPPHLSRIALFVPELFWPEPEDRDTLDGFACPELAALLARGRLSRQPGRPLESALAELFGHPADAPAAPFRRLGEAAAAPDGDAAWISADPVHLRLHQERLILADAGTLDIRPEEAEMLTAGLNSHFRELGCFHAAAPGRWYLRLADEAALGGLATPPLSTVAGRSIEQLLPEVFPDRASRNLDSMLQTFLHAHAVNRQREENGLATINSLWLWGQGRRPPRRESDFDGVWSGNPLAAGLARAAGVPTHALPAEAGAFFSHAAPAAQHLIVLEDFLAPVHYENGNAYRDAAESVEKRWFAPLRQALIAGRIGQLRIMTTTVYGSLAWECGPRNHWRFWQRTPPLAETVKNLAAHPQNTP